MAKCSQPASQPVSQPASQLGSYKAPAQAGAQAPRLICMLARNVPRLQTKPTNHREPHQNLVPLHQATQFSKFHTLSQATLERLIN